MLERSGASVLETVERLVGMQAQVPENPYVALWSRIEGFRPEELSELIEPRELVRAGLMRSTLHLVSARDCVAIHPLTLPVLGKTFNSPFAPLLNGADVDAVVAAGVELLEEAPRTRAQLSALLAERFPEADAPALALRGDPEGAARQTTPRGLWRQTGQATWAPADGGSARIERARRSTRSCCATWRPSARRASPTCAPGAASPACAR